MVWGDDGWYPPRHCAVRFMMMTGKYIMLSLSGDLLVQQKMWVLWDLLGSDHTKRFRDYGRINWL